MDQVHSALKAVLGGARPNDLESETLEFKEEAPVLKEAHQTIAKAALVINPLRFLSGKTLRELCSLVVSREPEW